MASWQIGKVSVTKLVEIEINMDWTYLIREATPEAVKAIPWLAPHFADDEGSLILSFHALLVEVGDLRIIVDTCFGNNKERRAEKAHQLQTAFMDDLIALGWTPDSIDLVMCTHLHLDHVGWNTMLVDGKWVPTFPNARYLIAEPEFKFWQANEEDRDQAQVFSDSVKPVFDAGLVDLVKTDHVICNEIRFLPSHGHTPGHVSVLIESEGEKALITGDFMHNPCQIAKPDWGTSFDEDMDAARVTRKAMLEEYADTGVLIIGTHFAGPTAGHLIREGESYRLKT